MARTPSYLRLSHNGKNHLVFSTILHVVEWSKVTVILSAGWFGIPVSALSATTEKAAAVLFETKPPHATIQVWHNGGWFRANQSLQEYRVQSGETTEEDYFTLMQPPANERRFQVFSLGDKINTPLNVEARIRPTQIGQEIRVLPDSQLELQARYKSRLSRGIARWLSRDSDETHWVQVEDTIGAASRTDFIVQVDGNDTAIFYVVSGEMVLSNEFAGITMTLTNGQAAWTAGGTGKLKPLSHLDMRVRRMVQAFLYYPGVLHLDEFGGSLSADPKLTDSVKAYSVGNLPLALALYPTNREPASNAERLYMASLVLTVGNYPAAKSLITNLATNEAHYSKHKELADAIEQVMAAAEGIEWDFSTLSLDDLTDFQSLARKLSRGETAVDQYVAARLSPATQEALADYQRDNSNALILQTALLEDFNRVIGGPSIYDTERFADVSLRSETRQALSHYHPDQDFRLLNRLLLGDAYPLELSRQHEEARREAPGSPTAWLAESYYQQSRVGRPYRPHSWERSAYGRASATSERALERALIAAKNATTNMTPAAPSFGFAWVRRAELEFSFGRIKQAKEALAHVKDQQEGNAQAMALQGFLAWARNDYKDALAWFERAAALDGRLGNAWLGIGLTELHNENMFYYFLRASMWAYWGAQPDSEGLRYLETAAAAEPDRSLLRSYLGKAYYDSSGWWGQDAWLKTNAFEQLDLAKRLDSNDPTPYLYSALIKQQENQINEAVRELERSIELNDNRAVYRSELLLDQDLAVRSANLAAIYGDAGMQEVSVREAARSVSYDYANYSAHLFLSESYNALRDPTRFNLRYETPWFNELLLANLLSPVGGTPLSQNISQQEYSKLFEQDRIGLSSSTEYRSDGQVLELASQYGNIGNTAWALDLDYQHNDGVRPNNELDRLEWYTTIKQQLTPRDSVMLLAKYQDYHSGDNFQYYEPTNARPNFSFDEQQSPILMGGYHHEWSPGNRTLALGGRLENDQRFADKASEQTLLYRDASTNPPVLLPIEPPIFNLDVDHRIELGIYTAEAQQIFENERHVLLLGGRWQGGHFDTHSLMTNPSVYPNAFPTNGVLSHEVGDFERVSAYLYETLKLPGHLRLTAGLTYEQMQFPENFRAPPIQGGEETRDRLNPKAAVVWNVLTQATFRAVYAQSLGGVSLDESFRLEPTQLAGFVQDFRTLIPESLVGSVAAPDHEIWGAALDLKFETHTYVGIQGEFLSSRVQQTVGVFDRLQNDPAFPPFYVYIVPSSTRQQLNYKESSASMTVNQLLSDEWSVGAQYSFVRSELKSEFPELVALPTSPDWTIHADLHRVNLFVIYNHRSGFFAQAGWNFYFQDQSRAFVSPDVPADVPDESFQQLNLLGGYRFPRRNADLTLGVLNLTGEDYRLNPVTPYAELPRERVFYARLRFRF